MISRIFRVGDEASEAGKTEKMLDTVGIKVRDLSTGTFREFDAILQDVAKSWDTLNNTEQMAVAQSIGGTMHYSKFIGLIENLSIATEASEKALNSQGSALIENEKALNSISGKWSILMANLNNTKLSIVEGDDVKNLLDIGIAITSLTQKFTGLKGIMAAMFMLSSKKIAIFDFITKAKDLDTFKSNIKGVYTSLIDFGKSVKDVKITPLINQIKGVDAPARASSVSTAALGTALETAGIKASLAAFKLQAFKAAATFGLGFALSFVIEKLIGFVASVINAKDELKQFNLEMNETMKTDTSSLTQAVELKEQMDIITDKLKSATPSEAVDLNSQLLELQKEMASVLPKTATGYDLSGTAIANNTALIDAMIESKKEEMAINALKFAEENEGFDKTIAKYDEAKKKFEEMQLAQSKGEKYVSHTQPIKVEKNMYTGETEEIDVVTKTKITTKAMKKLNEEVQAYELQMQTTINTVNSLRLAGFSDSQISAMGIDIAAVNRYLKELESNTKSINEIDNSPQVQKVRDLQDKYEALGYSVDDVNAKITDLANADDVTIDAKLTTDSTKVYTEAKAKVQELRQSVYDLNEEQAITPELLASLTSQYPQIMELGAAIEDVGSVQNFLNSQISDQTSLQNTAYQNMIANDKDYYNNKIKNNQEYMDFMNQSINGLLGMQGQSYEIDFGNYASLNDLKSGNLNQFGSFTGSTINSIIDMYNQAYTFDSNNFADLQSMKQGYINALIPAIANWIASKNAPYI